MSLNPKEMIQMMLEYHNKRINVDEICKKYDISRYTYYKRRKEVILTALNFLLLHFDNYGDKYYKLKKENESLQRKVYELEKDNEILKAKYNWIYFHLNAEQRNKSMDQTKARLIKRGD